MAHLNYAWPYGHIGQQNIGSILFSLSVNTKWWKSIFGGTNSCLCSDWCLFLPAWCFANNSMLCFNHCPLIYFFQVTEIPKMCKENQKLSDMVAHLAREPFNSRLTNTQLIIIVKMSIKQQIWLQRWMKTLYIISVSVWFNSDQNCRRSNDS